MQILCDMRMFACREREGGLCVAPLLNILSTFIHKRSRCCCILYIKSFMRMQIKWLAIAFIHDRSSWGAHAGRSLFSLSSGCCRKTHSCLSCWNVQLLGGCKSARKRMKFISPTSANLKFRICMPAVNCNWNGIIKRRSLHLSLSCVPLVQLQKFPPPRKAVSHSRETCATLWNKLCPRCSKNFKNRHADD